MLRKMLPKMLKIKQNLQGWVSLKATLQNTERYATFSSKKTKTKKPLMQENYSFKKVQLRRKERGEPEKLL